MKTPAITKTETFNGVTITLYKQWDGYHTLTAADAVKVTGLKYRHGYERRIPGTDIWVTPTQYNGKEYFYLNGY